MAILLSCCKRISARHLADRIINVARRARDLSRHFRSRFRPVEQNNNNNIAGRKNNGTVLQNNRRNAVGR